MTKNDIELVKDLALLSNDPYAFVQYAFPWGETGTILEHESIRTWQKKTHQLIRDKIKSGQKLIRVAVSSGHGIGKSAFIAQLNLWALSTHENTRVMVTANTESQLKTKTWPEITKWFHLFIGKKLFKDEKTSIHSREKSHELSWRTDMITWNERNPAAFAGLHNKGNRILFIMDEASGIPASIFEVVEGAMTDEDTQIIFIVFGNPTLNSGHFYNICFGSERNYWNTQIIDSREVEGVNLEELKLWEEKWGEDSDFFRVRVRGLPPNASSLQFIPKDLIYAAQKREAIVDAYDPLILGIDVARGGDDRVVFFFRRGQDARSIPVEWKPGSIVHDSMQLAAYTSELIRRYRPDQIFVDATGIGGPFADRIRQLGYPTIDIHFGGASPDKNYKYMRTYMWAKMKDWLEYGSIPILPELEIDLIGPLYYHTKRDELILESKDDTKKRGLASPDYADALALTFAMPVPKLSSRYNLDQNTVKHEFNPYEDL